MGWIVPKDNPNSRRDATSEEYGTEGNISRDPERTHERRNKEANQYPKHSSEERQENRFTQKLDLNIFSFCPDGFAKTNLTSPLSYRRQHHIHNPDATHDE
jgi:hypothetical protein